jgi:hypothetical protein
MSSDPSFNAFVIKEALRYLRRARSQLLIVEDVQCALIDVHRAIHSTENAMRRAKCKLAPKRKLEK